MQCSIIKICKDLLVACSMWTAIPIALGVHIKGCEEYVPRYELFAFTVLGAVVAVIQFALYSLLDSFGFGEGVVAVLVAVVPTVFSGGIHMDGFCDTLDAVKSHKSKDEKLAILKDSRVGAGAVIGCVVYFVIIVGLWHELIANEFLCAWSFSCLLSFCCIHYVSRLIICVAALSFPLANSMGLLTAFVSSCNKNVLLLYCLVSMIIVIILSVVFIGYKSLLLLALYIVAWFMLRGFCTKHFGGITGDVAGFALCAVELMSVACFTIVALQV